MKMSTSGLGVLFVTLLLGILPEGTTQLLAAAPDGWQEVRTDEGRFRVSLPGKAEVTRQTSKTSRGPVQLLVHKVSSDGLYWNFYVVTYPPAVIETDGAMTMLERLASANLKQKAGAQQQVLKRLEDVSYPALEHRYRYPSGRNSTGRYAAGRAVHRMYVVANQVCWLFVDITKTTTRDEDQIASDLQRFFESLTIKDARLGKASG